MKTSQDFNENFNQYSSEIEKEMSNLNRMLQEFASNGVVAQQIINDLEPVLAKLHLYFDIAFESLGKFISQIQKIDGFAAKIAETVDKTMNPYGKKVAFISEKQSWILAVAAVENNITL